MLISKLKTLLLAVLVSCSSYTYCQNSTELNLKQLDKFLVEENYSNAKIFAKKNIDSLIKINQFYEVTDYVYYLGQIESNINGKDAAIKVITDFESSFISITEDNKALRQLALETGSFYESIGDSETAKNYNIKALEITKQMPEATGKDLALIESNIGVFYSRLGNIPKATDYHKSALISLKSDSNSEADSYYITYNSLGAMMWYASKFDSAVYYYKKADKTLKSLEQTPWNKFYRSASLNNNIAAVYSIQGNLDASINAMQTTVNNITAFLKEDVTDIRRTHVREFLFQAIDNYAGLYKDVGDFRKAKQLITYAYEQKQKYLTKNSPEIIKAKVLLGQINFALKNYNKANILLDQGIAEFKKLNGNYSYWLADASYSKAIIAVETGNLVSAKDHYLQSEGYYKVSLGEYYDEAYLDFTINASNFFVQLGKKEKALSMASEALEYIKANQGEKTILEYFQLLNLADIYYQTKDYENTLNYCNEAIELLNSNDFIKNSELNSLQVESNKVGALLLRIKVKLKLNKNRNEVFLNVQLADIDEAIKLLENKKSFISSNDNSTSILIQDNIDVFRIAKQLNLELYKLTKNQDYLEALLSYHESMIYHKIRNRLNSNSAELTANLPIEVLEKEKKLKNQLNAYLDHNTSFNTFLENEKKWYAFLEQLKIDYPNYYNLRYQSISQNLQNIKGKIPKGSTVVRYLYIDNKLFAFVINDSSINMINIHSDKIDSKINNLNKKIELIESPFSLQSDIYNILWKPLENYIKTKHVIILPDKDLFNLSFDLLTPKSCESYRDLKENSLLAKHQISYNYSLFLIDKKSQPVSYDSNFIGFAPEFNETMKTNYKIAIKDSLNIDYSYLKLLPQPFAKDLAKNYSRFFNGDSFLNENASKQIFTKRAKEHKIIHIGTHAESDNVSPEFSRLIFAKNSNDENNSLYTYEIYNQNLSSNLAILTACETGKPTFQPGEGMISLAHAFNYAGSESILTSLWKIDEQSSTVILDNFYTHLKSGFSKDEALQKAKLDYLATAEGRTLSPQYWAGLVLIGDNSPIDISTFNYWWICMFIGLAIMIAIVLFVRRSRSSKL